MTKMSPLYQCAVCKRIVAEIQAGDGVLICHDQPMIEIVAQSHNEGEEKHLPVIEVTEQSITVKIGSIPHPMTPEHYIEWIEIMVDGKNCKQLLSPTDQPLAIFPVSGQSITARAYCNIHGLWQSSL